MERRVSDNADNALPRPGITPDGLPQGWNHIAWPEFEDDAPSNQGEPEPSDAGPPIGNRFPDETPPAYRGSRITVPKQSNQGPCLYLGPAGQRCDRPAASGGFCAAHRPGASLGDSIKNPARVLAAAAAIIALLWPYIDDLVRELLRWANSR